MLLELAKANYNEQKKVEKKPTTYTTVIVKFNTFLSIILKYKHHKDVQSVLILLVTLLKL